jgi:Ca2+-binding EF-hand superfamily protein
MRRGLVPILAFSTFFLAGTVFAQSDVTSVRHQRFIDRDADRDGYLTLGEYGGHPGNFRALDRDSDSRLSRDEFVRRGGGATVALPDEFAYLDLNGDSTLSRAEWYGKEMAFERVDRDDNERITRDEFRTPLVGDNRQDRFYGRDSNGDGVLSRREWRSEGIAFGSADADNDGVVSLREYVGAPERRDDRSMRFDEMDRDEDGFVERQEWRGTFQSFSLADRNEDGRIALREYLNTVTEIAPQEFLTLDRNRDGFLSRAEWSGSRESFARWDRNGDGRVSRSEFAAPYVSGR